MKGVIFLENYKEILDKKVRLKKAMNKLKEEAASEMGAQFPMRGNDMTSGEIGAYAGPVGGVIVKNLIAQGEKALMEKQQKK